MLLDQLLALVAPPSCVSCRAATQAGERLCPACTRALPWLRRACPRCALPTHRRRTCPAAAAAFPRAWAPMAYEGVARDLVTALKFRAALGVADLMAAHMAATMPPGLRGPTPATAEDGVAWPSGLRGPTRATAEDGVAWPPGVGRPPHDASPLGVARPGAARREDVVAVVVPVPTVASRRRRRGFDPAGVLAAALARRLDRPLAACLRRRDHEGRQVGTGRAARRAPGRLAFAVRGPPPRLVLLVDDVHTTGTTLDAAARALAAEGAVVLAALSYARTL